MAATYNKVKFDWDFTIQCPHSPTDVSGVSSGHFISFNSLCLMNTSILYNMNNIIDKYAENAPFISNA